MIDWLTWWFGFVYGRAKKADGAAEAVWKGYAEDAAQGILDAHGGNKTNALADVAKVAFDDEDYMDAVTDYIDNA